MSRSPFESLLRDRAAMAELQELSRVPTKTPVARAGVSADQFRETVERMESAGASGAESTFLESMRLRTVIDGGFGLEATVPAMGRSTRLIQDNQFE